MPAARAAMAPRYPWGPSCMSIPSVKSMSCSSGFNATPSDSLIATLISIKRPAVSSGRCCDSTRYPREPPLSMIFSDVFRICEQVSQRFLGGNSRTSRPEPTHDGRMPSTPHPSRSEPPEPTHDGRMVLSKQLAHLCTQYRRVKGTQVCHQLERPLPRGILILTRRTTVRGTTNSTGNNIGLTLDRVFYDAQMPRFQPGCFEPDKRAKHHERLVVVELSRHDERHGNRGVQELSGGAAGAQQIGPIQAARRFGYRSSGQGCGPNRY